MIIPLALTLSGRFMPARRGLVQGLPGMAFGAANAQYKRPSQGLRRPWTTDTHRPLLSCPDMHPPTEASLALPERPT